MAIMQRYADTNRKAMRQVLVEAMDLTVTDSWTTVHNYIDLDSMILRKGAVSAQAGERILIPLNMRDGSLICLGKGNPDWNQSAPHGAGRLMSRRQARQAISMAEYEKSMTGIYTTSVSRDTLDEAAFAYKPLEEIAAHITPAAQIIKQIKPIYNFKAAD
jgi:RNA-splicing ligase RtcB